jgi:hypothetical protein
VTRSVGHRNFKVTVTGRELRLLTDSIWIWVLEGNVLLTDAAEEWRLLIATGLGGRWQAAHSRVIICNFTDRSRATDIEAVGSR